MISRELLDIYAGIPAFKCKDGCTKCCGPIPLFLPQEWANITEKRRATGYHCPYLTAQGCSIYPVRSFICRLFGTVEGLECPEGCGPEKLLTHDEGTALKIRYFTLED